MPNWRGMTTYVERTAPQVTDRILIESAGGVPAGISYADLRKIIARGEPQVTTAINWTYSEATHGQDVALEVTALGVAVTLPANQGLAGAQILIRNASSPGGDIFVRVENPSSPGTYVDTTVQSGRRTLRRKAATGGWWVNYGNAEYPFGNEGSLLGRIATGSGEMASFGVSSLTEETAAAAGHMVIGWVGSALRKFDLSKLGRALRSTQAGNALTGDVKVWSGTATAYAAIGTKDPNTIYFVDEA